MKTSHNPSHPSETLNPNSAPHADAPPPGHSGEILALYPDPRAGTSMDYQTPAQQWTESVIKERIKDELTDIEMDIYQKTLASKGQRHRLAQDDESFSELPLPPTHGPLQLPESYDPEHAQPGDEYYGSQTERHTDHTLPAHEILRRTAQDMAMVGHVLAARLRVSIGYAPDALLISQYRDLAVAITKMHYVSRPLPGSTAPAFPTPAAEKKPVGRPRKSPPKPPEGG